MTTTVTSVSELTAEDIRRPDREPDADGRTDGLYLRPLPDHTLSDLLEVLSVPSNTLTVNTTDVAVKLLDDDGFESDGEIRLGEKLTVPGNRHNQIALANFLQLPTPLMKRLEPEEREFLLRSRLRYNPGVLVVDVEKESLLINQIHEPGRQVIEPEQLVTGVAKVMGYDSQVIEYVNGDTFGFDAVVREGSGRGEVVKDRKVGDITRGGVRVEQDRKHNLAPSVQPYTLTLVCTNGMEVPDKGLKIDARGQSVEDVLIEFELMAQRAFAQVEDRINSFYELRNQKVDNPERTIMRLAREFGMPERTVLNLAQQIPAYIQDDANATEFDLVNMVTNLANVPGTSRPNRLALERFGGHAVNNHVARCNHCKHKLN